MSFEDNLKKLGSRVRFSAHKKADLRGRLLRHVEADELVRGRGVDRQLMQRSISIRTLFKFKTMPIYAVVLIAALVGGGTSIAAKHSLPGDALYAVKSFNENVRAGLTISARAKANYDVKLVEKRLEEAETLAAENKLEGDVKVQVEENFKAFADRVSDRTEKLADTDAKAAADITANFQTALEAHEDILARFEARGASDITDEVRAKAVMNKEVRAKADAEVFTGVKTDDKAFISFANRRKESALAAIRAGEQFIAANRASLSDEDEEAATVRLRAALDLTKEGDKYMSVDVSEAARLYQESLDLTHKVMIYLKANTKIESKSDVKIDVDAELKAIPIRNLDVKIGSGADARSEVNEDKEVSTVKPILDVKTNTVTNVKVGF